MKLYHEELGPEKTYTLLKLIIYNYIIILFLAVLGLGCCVDFSLVVVSRGYSLVAVRGLLAAMASLFAKHGL